MSSVRYQCCDERRRTLLAAPATPANVSGIDYIEVHAGATTADPTTIDIVLVKPLTLPAAALTGANISISGGVRFAAPVIDPVVVAQPGGSSAGRYVITVPGNQPTDFSTYRLAIVAGPGSATPPSFIDARLSDVEFSFKVECPSDFDCAPECDSSGGHLPPDPMFDYRVRDYEGFRRQMLDRLSQLVPGFREDDPIDFTTTLVETAAYRADQQSYRLDWVGTEAFLFTARSRTSIARHARLVDYPVSEGASARVFARFELSTGGGIADGMVLAASTPLLVRTEGLPDVVPTAEYRRVLVLSPVVFETAAPLQLWRWRNHIAFHTWSDDECRLAKGATAATLVDTSGGAGSLAAGDLLLLVETVSPDTGDPDDAAPDHRHLVRLTRVSTVSDVLNPAPPNPALVTVEWSEQDALPFDLVIQSQVRGALASAPSVVCAEASANIMVADHGASLPPAPSLGLPDADIEALRPALTPPVSIADEPWRPLLQPPGLARIDPLRLGEPMLSAAALSPVDPARCSPALALEDDFGTWAARRDLLESGPFSRDFIIETTIDGGAMVRFGDQVDGLSPAAGTVLVPRGRFGVGPSGNIGRDALAHVVLPLAQQGARLSVTNPLPAQGGAAPERVSAIRIAAPEAFRRIERAVTGADYAETAKRHTEVANAVGIPRWTGAWQTMLVYVDRKGGTPVDESFRRALLEHMERYRLIGFDVSLRGAVTAPLDVELLVCAKPDQLRSTVAKRVRDALRPSGGASGVFGFFHADNFTFGSPLYLSRLIASVMTVEGVQSVTPRKFQRLRRLSQDELADGVIRPSDLEVLQLDDDPNFPERGRLVLAMAGGR
jgi:hypothetical protein